MNRFIGDFKEINPSWLKIGNGRLENFFLGLGIIFNDLKGLILFEKLLIESYEEPKKDEKSSHYGNYGGVKLQINKLMASTLNEFFIFFEKYKDIFSSSEFKDVLSRLTRAELNIFNAIVGVSCGGSTDIPDIFRTFAQIRSNLAFHYDHSGKLLGRGFDSFFGTKKHSRNSSAYYSIGETVELTRFYFCDGVVEELLYTSAGKKKGEVLEESESFKKYQSQIMEIIRDIMPIIQKLMENYIKICRYRPHSN